MLAEKTYQILPRAVVFAVLDVLRWEAWICLDAKPRHENVKTSPISMEAMQLMDLSHGSTDRCEKDIGFVRWEVPSLKLTGIAPQSMTSQKESNLPTVYFQVRVRCKPVLCGGDRVRFPDTG